MPSELMPQDSAEEMSLCDSLPDSWTVQTCTLALNTLFTQKVTGTYPSTPLKGVLGHLACNPPKALDLFTSLNYPPSS